MFTCGWASLCLSAISHKWIKGSYSQLEQKHTVKGHLMAHISSTNVQISALKATKNCTFLINTHTPEGTQEKMKMTTHWAPQNSITRYPSDPFTLLGSSNVEILLTHHLHDQAMMVYYRTSVMRLHKALDSLVLGTLCLATEAEGRGIIAASSPLNGLTDTPQCQTQLGLYGIIKNKLRLSKHTIQYSHVWIFNWDFWVKTPQNR